MGIMKAIVLVGSSSQLRPVTLTVPLPLLEFANRPLLKHQLQALKDAGVKEVVFCVQRRMVSAAWDDAVAACEAELGMKITCSIEPSPLGTAGPLKHAEALIAGGAESDGGTSHFFVINSDVLCEYPLRDLLRHHLKHGLEGTALTTRTADTSKYGVVVTDPKTGLVRHFVERPTTYVSDVINAGVYVFSTAVLRRIPAGERVSLNTILPEMAADEQLQSMLLTGHWTKLTDAKSFMAAIGPHLEMCRFMQPELLVTSASAAGYEVRGDVMVHTSARVGAGCVLGPRVVVGPGCELGEGVRLEDSTLFEGVCVRAHSLVKGSLIGWRSEIGKWCFVVDSVFGEEVTVADALLVRDATVLPQKELTDNIRTAQVVI